MDNLATSALPVSSHEEDNQVSVNAAFYRKLTQQIVQKDNIIKLLRLQVEELNSSSTEGGSSALSYGSSEETESLKAQLDELTRELNEERSRLRTLLREDGFTKEERQELDEQLQVSRQEITSYSAINKSLEHKIKELTAERDSLSLRLVNLSDEFSELSTMEVVSPEDMKLLEDELEESRKEVADLESENKRLHKRLAEAKEELATTGEALAILQEKLETANRKLDSLPDVEKLEEENTLLDETCRELDAANEDLKSRLNAMVASLNETRASSARRFSSSDWRILSGVVQMYDAILHMSDSIPDPDLEALTSYGLPIIIDFGADSCVPCKEMAPVLKTMNAEMQRKAIIKFVDVWKHGEAADEFPIQVIPTQVFINADGTPYVPSEDIEIEFTMYSTKDTNEHVFTVHQGGLTEEQMRAILADMGVAE